MFYRPALCFGQDDVEALVAYSEAECGFNMAHDVLAGDLYLLESDYRLDSFSLGLLDKSKLRIIRNTFFARHGYEFRSKDLNTHFQSMPWYKPSNSYSDTMLTKIDKFNIEIVQSFEFIDIAQAPELEADDIVGLWHVSW